MGQGLGHDTFGWEFPGVRGANVSVEIELRQRGGSGAPGIALIPGR